jgi:DNA polymerase III sliding clamp (beta) subunit (PCNA family)
VILPRKTVLELIKLLNDSDEEVSVEIAKDKSILPLVILS